MENLVEVILRLRDEASGALRQVAQAAEQARQRIGSLSDNLAQVSRGLQGLGSSLGAVLGTAGLTYALKSAADAAFEAQTGMQVLARTAAMAGVDFGKLRSTLDPLLESLGVLPEQAAQATAQLLRAGLSVEQIAAAFQAGAASALAAGRTAAEGIEAVAMALSTGQSVYLNYIGIAENIGPVLRQVASSMQGASEEAIRQAQNQAALNVILNATKNEVASLPDLLGGYAGAQNRLNQSLYEAQKAIGEAVLPYLTALIELVNEGVQAFNDLDPEIKRLIGTGAVAAGGILGLGTAMGLLLPVIQNAITVFRGLAGALLALAANPITLVVAGAAAIAVAWARSADTADETRRRWALLAQAAIGLYDILKGVAQSIAGLFSSVGQLFSTIAAAFSKVLKGDFVGAWQEVRRGINLEVFAAKFEAANRSLTEGWRNLSSTMRGEVLDSTNKVLEKFQSLADQVRGAAKGTENLTAKLPDYSRAVGQAANASEKKEKAAKSLADALDVLKKRYELGQLSLDQYLAGLRGLLGKWETHLRGLKEGTDEWKRYADAVLAAKRAIEDASTIASRMTRSERERRAPRDWSGVMTGPEVRGVEGWRDAILDTLRLGSTAYGQLMDQIFALEARLARGGLSQEAERELRALLDIAKKTAEDWKGEIEAALEREQDDMVAQARALGESVGEAIAEGIGEGFSSAQNALAQRIQEELEALKLDIPGGLLTQLEEDLAAVRAAVLTGVIPESDLPQLLSDIANRAEQTARSLYEAGELSAAAFLKVWERVKRVREEVGALSQPPALPESETSSGFLLFLQGIPSQAEAALQTVRDLTYVMGPNELGEVIAANIAYLQELQAQVPPTTRGYQILSNVIGELRVMYLELLPVVQIAGEEIQTQAEDYYDVAGGASAYAEEVRNLLDQLREGTLSQEQFNEALARLREDLAIILPVWEAWLKSQEEAGVNTEGARKALAQLQQALAKVGVEVQKVSRQRLSAWASGLARDIQTAADAMFGLMGAFSAPSFGQGLATFARGVEKIVSLIPGLGPAIGDLVSTIGGVLGSVVDGILSMFDNGMAKVQAKLNEASSTLKLVDPAILQRAVEAYTESYLFGLINVTKYRVNEAIMESLQEAAKAAEGAIQSGLRAALTGEDPVKAFRDSLYNATLDAVVDALMESEAVRAALSPYATALTEAIAQGSAEGVLRAAQGLAEAFAGLEELLAPIREAFAQMRREMEVSRMWEDAQQGAATAIEGAIRTGAKAALEGRDISEAWREVLYQSTLDALVQAFLNQGWMRALQPFLDQLASAILTSDEAAIPGIIAQIAAVIEAISRHMDDLGPVAEELRRLLGIEAAKQLEEDARGVEGVVREAVRGALQSALTAEDPARAWREAIYRSTLDALTSALLESEAIKAALRPFQDALARAIAEGNVEGILQATEALAAAFASIAPALEQVREALRGVLEGGGGAAPVENLLARSIAEAVRGGLRSALTGEDWQAELSERIRNAILDAVLNAAISEAVIQGMLGPLIESLAEAIGEGNWQAVSVLSGMLARGAESLVELLTNSLSPLADQFSALHRTAESAARGLESISGATTNLPSWYRVDLARFEATQPVQVHIYGNVYGVDDLVDAIEGARRRRGYSITGGWA